MNNSTTTTGHQEQCDVSLFKGKGKICSVFGEPNDNSIICNVCHCKDTVLWNKCHYAKGYKEYNNISSKEWENVIFNNMETKEIKISVPDGYEIDKENSTFEKIVFKPVVKRWRDEDHVVNGYYIGTLSDILKLKTTYSTENHNIFATKKQAKSALAMAQISQIMANDKRFGGVVTDEEWENVNMIKHIITRLESKHINETLCNISYTLLAFHTKEQRELFLEENRDLVKDYLMID